jgi:Domain of unknown function (DUF4157)
VAKSEQCACKTPPTVSPPMLAPGRALQRQCSCGQHTVGGGQCAECSRHSRVFSQGAGDRTPAVASGSPASHSLGFPPSISTLDFARLPVGERPLLTDWPGMMEKSALENGDSRRARDPRKVLAGLGEGQPFAGEAKSRMESAFGQNFSHVRIHTDSRAAGISQNLNASALTVANHVAFASGQYAPGTIFGDALLAHELAHVSQQNGMTSFAPAVQTAGGEYDALERDADVSAEQAVRSLWSKAKGFPAFVARGAGPRLRSGVRISLNSCFGSGSKEKESKKTDPKEEKKARTCDQICNDAYADSSLNSAGGGVICDGSTKCACTFDIPVGSGIKRGECPEIDRIAKKHEERHLVDVDCDASKGLHRPPFKDPSKATSSECAHRKETSDELNEAIKKAADPCKTKMNDLKSVLDTWVKANCGGP